MHCENAQKRHAEKKWLPGAFSHDYGPAVYRNSAALPRGRPPIATHKSHRKPLCVDHLTVRESHPWNWRQFSEENCFKTPIAYPKNREMKPLSGSLFIAYAANHGNTFDSYCGRYRSCFAKKVLRHRQKLFGELIEATVVVQSGFRMALARCDTATHMQYETILSRNLSNGAEES